MSTAQLIQRLRVMLTEVHHQDQYDTLCAAIRALGGNP